MNYENWIEYKTKNNSLDFCIKNDDIKDFLYELKNVIYPGVLECSSDNDYLINKIDCVKRILFNLLEQIKKICSTTYKTDTVVDQFLSSFPLVNELLDTDIDAIYCGDPACENEYEIILCYPGFKAIFTYRFAHVLYSLGVPILPRLLTELAHSETGIDIHPGAKIDSHFFIDHGTGIVIGETTEIGKNVKIYQGVTLGALSLRKGQSLKGVKRHPTIGDNVTIYSGASIFGGDTVIGHDSTIGSSAFITESIEPNSLYTINGIKTKVNK